MVSGAGNGIPSDELSGDVGRPDPATMRAIRDLFLEHEPLVEETAFDSPLHPREIRIYLSDGIGDADRARLDVGWYRTDAYRFHYVGGDDVNWRFDRHPNPHSPPKHFHEPPDATSHDAVASCIEVEEPALVARAVWKIWRRAFEADDAGLLNTAQNPP